MDASGGAEEHTLIGGHFDGRRVTIEADREYVVLAVNTGEPAVDAMALAALNGRPIEVSDVRTVDKAIYTRRRVFFDRFEPMVVFGAIELTDREIMALLIGGYRSRLPK
jgi:hypothetical protein